MKTRNDSGSSCSFSVLYMWDAKNTVRYDVVETLKFSGGCQVWNTKIYGFGIVFILHFCFHFLEGQKKFKSFFENDIKISLGLLFWTSVFVERGAETIGILFFFFFDNSNCFYFWNLFWKKFYHPEFRKLFASVFSWKCKLK